jgi:WD40 repeat protein
MIRFQLPTDRVTYLQLAFPACATGLVVRWGHPYTVATWDGAGRPLGWQLSALFSPCLSPDGEWVSSIEERGRKARIIRVGAAEPTAVLEVGEKAAGAWSAVAPGGVAVAWKDDQFTVVRALPGGEPIARVKSGWAIDLRFSPGGRWLTEKGVRVFRVFDRANNYKAFARVPTPSYAVPDVTDGTTAVVNTRDENVVAVWNLPAQSPAVALAVGGPTCALALSADGRRVLTCRRDDEVALWDAASGACLQRYNWKVAKPIAAAFSRDGMRAAVGGEDGQVVVWDLDD